MRTYYNQQPKPFLCGGYTSEDWAILNGARFTHDFHDHYGDCDDAIARDVTYLMATKPDWA